MAEVTLENLQANLRLVGEAGQATPYFEQWLYQVIEDLNALTLGGIASIENVGDGAGVWRDTVDAVASLRSIESSDDSVSITQDTDTIDLQVSGAIAAGTVNNSILTWDGVAWSELTELLFSYGAGAITMQVEDSLGVNQIVALFDADAESSLYHNGTATLRTATSAAGGAEANNISTGTGWERVLTTSDLSGGSLPTPTVESSILTGDLVGGEFDELTDVTIAWAAGVTTIQGEDVLGTLQDLIVADADAGVELYFEGVNVMRTQAQGIHVGTNSAVADDPFIGFYDSETFGTQVGFIRNHSSLGFELYNQRVSQQVNLVGTNSSSAPSDILVGNPDGSADLYFDGNKVIETHSSGFYIAGFAAVGIFSGSGSPENSVTASIGSLYMRTDGGANTTFYVKESGAGNTGWVAK